MAALMCTLDAKQRILTDGGYPQYSSAILFELWNTSCLNHTKDGYCNYRQFRNGGIDYYPGNEYKLCQDTESKNTAFNPDDPEPPTPKPGAASVVSTRLALIIVLIFLFCNDREKF
ncbi:unnamed protein product [Gongylonema pulchrum]|uniref:Uncharacterized protein n=1 Tax=Gongylonema pulchrum TaxID=637853 RepID=A0A3P7NYZ9_9BILA|nr:unnamed protein product [Gongylonema pulchrum]